MIICSKCKEEMLCKRTGVVVVWSFAHARKGDEYECGSCGSTTISANPQSYHLSPLERQHAEESGKLVQMD